MRRSSQKTTAAVLRKFLGIRTSEEMARILKRSEHTIRSVESGRLKLSPSLAVRMFHETGISIDWLMKGDPTVPPIAESGEPYTPKIYERTQAQKLPYDEPGPKFRSIDKLGFCARLIAILESASAKKDYFMARYKVDTALDSLRREFGMDEKVYLYQHSAPHRVNGPMANAALKGVLADYKEMERWRKQTQRLIEQSQHSTPKPKKKQSSKKRR
jgi:hypothetical protein